MAEEIAKLVGVLFDDKASSSSNDIRLRSEKSGLEKLYLILKQGVETNSDGKLGLQRWEHAQIQAVMSVAYAIVSSTRSISVEQVEPIIVAVMEQSLEFALCCLENSVASSDDLSFIQLLEIALVDGTIKEADMSHPSSMNLLIDSLKSITLRNENVELQDHIECIVQGNSCSTEKKPVDRLLMTLVSEWTQHDNMNSWTIGRSSHDFNKLVPLLQHWAVVHLGCIQRLVSHCMGLVENLDRCDEKIDSINLRKRLSFCARIFKLLASVTKDAPYVEYDAKLLGSFASFTNGLPSLFRSGYEFATSNVSVEFNIESLVLFLLEAFLHLVHTIFCNSNVFQNILVCVIVSVFENLDVDVWRYDKSITNIKLPVAYFPRIVLYILKLVEDIKKHQYQALELKGIHAGNSGNSADFQVDSFLCGVGSERISLVKKYTTEELLKVIFPTSKQWVDNLMHLAFFLHSEGVKMLPKLDRSYSSCTKASSTLEPESTVCHEDEALFGDLFSEGGRSVGSTDGYDQSVIAASSVTNVCNMPLHAATEVFIFLKTSAFSPEWHSSIYEDACKKLNSYHIDIMLSILCCQGCHAGDRTSDAGVSLSEHRKFVHTHEVCYEVLHNLISFHALSDSLEEYLVCKILTVENGSFVYNHQTLALLAHTLICRVGLSGNQLRTKVQKVFVEFVFEKVKSVCARCPSLKELIETLPSVLHIEILLMSFHLSSESEKTVQANFIFSSIRTIEPLSYGFSSTQLSCWALLVSRLVLILRHMIFYPNVCPPMLLSELKSKLREAPLARSVPPGNAGDRMFWASTFVENVMRVFTIEGEVSSNFLNQLIDVTSFTASACREDLVVECLGLNWDEVRSSFSWILGFWRGKRASTMEDLVLERYIFMLCWDIPPMHTTLDLLPSCSDLQTLDITSIEHLLYFGHSILGGCRVARGANFSKLVFCVLEQLQSMPISEEPEELGWDFLRSGSWLSLVLSLLRAGNQRCFISNEIASVGSVLLEHASRDAEFLTLAEKLIFSCLVLMCDMAQISGLIAAKECASPFEFCDIVTSTTHKSLRGPRGGIIFYRKGPKPRKRGMLLNQGDGSDRYDFEEKINFAVCPALQGGPHNNHIAALAIALKQLATPEYKEYMQQVKKNAQALASALLRRNCRLVTGGTDNHLLLWDLRNLGLTGKNLEKVCEMCHITVNKIAIFDDNGTLIPGGVRIGTPAMTSRGCLESDFEMMADFLCRAAQITSSVQREHGKMLKCFLKGLENNKDIVDLGAQVENFATQFAMPGQDL